MREIMPSDEQLIKWGEKQYMIDRTPLKHKGDDLRGQSFNRLLVLSYSKTDKYRSRIWQCACLCGNQVEVRGTSLKNGHSKSCNCFMKESSQSRMMTHGDSGSFEYSEWEGMKHRCNRTDDKTALNYKNRGINWCKRWDEYINFLADMGRCPEDKESLDRVDNNKGYWCGKSECPECSLCNREPNCQWATREEQSWNRQNTVYITFEGVRGNNKFWSEKTGIPVKILQSRRELGWTDSQIISTPYPSKRGGRRG